MSGKNGLWVVVLAASLAGGCASIRRQSVATTLSGATPLVVSSEIDPALSTEYFALVNVTFENAGADWVDVKRVDLVPQEGLAEGDVRVVTGGELAAWADAMRRVLEVKRVNESSAYGWSLVTLAAIARVRGAQPGEVAATLQMIDLAKSSFADDYKDEKRAERLGAVPVGHLLAGGMLVPPGLHADRWILLGTRGEKGRPRTLKARLTLGGGVETTLLIYVTQKPPA